MKNNLKHKSLLEKGGLMIEALAMLGLIAVVTPTMYKKSAERTMEVDDINTATTIRSYVSAAESYMTTNYVSIMKDFKDAVPEGGTQPAEQYKSITNNDLADFLPYKFKSASSLYDYNEPKVTVVKNGNNLTAFLLFPAKGAGDDGLGQERTARIASLVGANGGYVRSEHNARGIGGIWSLNGTTYTNVFPSDNSPIYSIVASTPNAINGNTQIDEFENPKYLQRTFECSEDATEAEKARCKEEETWRNTMRTDLYLGGYNSFDELPEDNPNSEKMHNIRNIGSLIVGAEEQADNYSGATSYGLYIAENVNNNATKDDGTGHAIPNPNAKSNAYIGGSLMAGLRQFFVDKDSLNYGQRTEYNFETHEEEQVGYEFNVSSSGDVTQYGNLNLAIFDSYCGYPQVRIGSYPNGKYLINAKADDNIRKITLMGNDNLTNGQITLTSSMQGDAYSNFISYDAFSNETSSQIHGGAINIGNAYPGKGGLVNVFDGISRISTENIDNIAYKAPQHFPVTIGENTYVQGLLAADQLDTQKLRTASLSTGSEHVDDQFQWLNVDKDGVVIASTTRTGEAYSIMDTEVHIDDSGVSMRYGGNSSNPKAKLQLYGGGSYSGVSYSGGSYSGGSYSGGSYSGGSYSAGVGRITGEATDIKFKTEDAGTLALYNNNIGQYMTEKQISIGGLDSISNGLYSDVYSNSHSNYNVTYTKNGNVNLLGANLRVGYIKNGVRRNVLSVNTDPSTNQTFLPDGSLQGSGYPENFDVAMHGNVLFTGIDDKFSVDDIAYHTKYLSIGQQTDAISDAAGVEIINNRYGQDAHKVVMINMAQENTPEYLRNGVRYTGYSNMSMDQGTVYIRKGAVDVLPIIPNSNAKAGYDVNATATRQIGYIGASRFVANNRDTDGNLVQVPDFINGTKYNKYNTTSKDGRYDTYMVNPAYTSVMHDIKLTSRGGARLSDVLPNFIIKSIYLSTNDKDDTLTNFTFQHAGATVTCGGGSCPESNTSPWASPYTGYIPAPQCPPGYSRVLTFTPVSMYMAQAGQLTYNETTGTGANHYTVEEDLMTLNGEYYKTDTVENQAKIEEITPMYRRAKLKLGEESVHSMDLSTSGSTYADGYSNVTHYVSDVKGLEVAGVSDDYSTNYPYVLTAGSKDQSAMPFTFQQNTWLKTLSVPMCAEAATVYGSSACQNHYIRSWALLMGFVYTQDIYRKYLADPTVRKANDLLYWNVFPITKGSLEGTATTYCYFNRSNMSTTSDTGEGANTFINDYNKYFSEDKYLSLEDSNMPTGYNKVDGAYKERLNDPTLKYTEEW